MNTSFNLDLLSVNLKKVKQLFLAFFVFLSMQAFSTQFTETTDSLYQSLKQGRLTTTKKLNILYDIINYHYLSNQYDEMKFAIEEAYKLLQGSRDSCLLNKFLLMEAKFASSQNNNSKAISLTDNILISSHANYCPEVEVSTLLFQSKLLLHAKDPEIFMNKVKLARQLSLKIKNEVLIARTYNMEGIWNLINNHYAESRKFFFVAVETFTKFKENAMAGKAYSDIADSYYSQSVYDSSIIYGNIAIPWLEKGNSYGDLGDCFNKLGNTYQYLGKLDKAIESYFDALKIADYLNSGIDRTKILYNLGNCYYNLDAKAKALENYYFCFEQAEQNFDTTSIIYSSNAIGNMALEQNNTDTAYKYIDKALSLAKIVDNTYAIMFCSTSMASVETERSNFILAEQYLKIAHKYADELNNPIDIINIDIARAILLAKEKKYNQSISLLQETYERTLQVNSFEIIRYILKTFADIYEKSGDTKNALFYFKKVEYYKDSIYSASMLTNLVNREIQYEKEKTEKIRQLEFEKAEIKRISELKSTRLYVLLLIISVIALIITVWLFYKLSKSRKKRNQDLTEKNILIQSHSNELNEMIEKLQSTTNNLEIANKTKSKLLSIIGHDLKNPFNVIQGYISILSDAELNLEQRKKYYRRIKKASDQLLDMVDSLVLWSKTQTNKIQFNPVKTSITEISNQSISFLQNNAKLKNIQIIYDYDKNQNIIATVDPDMLKRVIHNLLINAIKFTEEEGKIFIGFDLKDSYLTYWVKDTGIGMNQKVAANIFGNSSEFVQDGTNGEKGTGLGLSICSEFIRYHQGKIWAESKPNQGASFIFKIPVE